MRLDDIATVLGISKPAASLLRAGKYDREGSELPARYARLMAMIDAAAARGRAAAAGDICMTCPRQDCTGCRVAEIAEI